jgi:Helix-hairpin-helix motif
MTVFSILQSHLILLLFTVLLWITPAHAATGRSPQLDRPLLTAELLQSRITHPLPSEGCNLIDLRKLTIDLRPENPEFAETFYKTLHEALEKPGIPLGIDLSNSSIAGPLDFARLGVQSPLYDNQLSPLFTPAEQTQLKRDRRRLARLSTLSQSLLLTPRSATPSNISVFRGALRLTQTEFLGPTDFANTFFLNRVEATNAHFLQTTDWSQTRFSGLTRFSGVDFDRETRFRSSIFFGKAEFNQARFQGTTTFQSSEFQDSTTFNQVTFNEDANFTRTQWQGSADFAQTQWQHQALFSKAKFNQALFLTDATFNQVLLLREAQFSRPVNLRGAVILDRADLSYSSFGKDAYLNVPGLRFDSDRAKIVGDPGRIGKVISVPTIQGNENLLRELIRNFRRMDQITDANQLDYTAQKLRSRELLRRVFGLNLNTATPTQLIRLGLTPTQADAIVQRNQTQPMKTLTELLSVGEIDLATYTSVRDRVITVDALPMGVEFVSRIGFLVRWIGVGAVLVLSRNGTNFWLIFGVGLLAVAHFAVIFWAIDRARRRLPSPILPSLAETGSVLSLATVLGGIGLTAIFQNADHPWTTIVWSAVGLVPIPGAIVALIYQRGRFHPKLDASYFVEEGTLRQLRILIGRLPVIPRYPLFRDRYIELPWEKRWNWLNYFDFSFNNFLRFGFNDIRVRDEFLPGLLTTLVWYQWTLGTLYIALLLWTLSRTIPGLNLLIYFR